MLMGALSKGEGKPPPESDPPPAASIDIDHPASLDPSPDDVRASSGKINPAPDYGIANPPWIQLSLANLLFPTIPDLEASPLTDLSSGTCATLPPRELSAQYELRCQQARENKERARRSLEDEVTAPKTNKTDPLLMCAEGSVAPDDAVLVLKHYPLLAADDFRSNCSARFAESKARPRHHTATKTCFFQLGKTCI